MSYINTMTYDTAEYVYKKNLQGDIIGILDSNLNEVVKYTYDSWGKVLSVTDAEGNEITDEFHIGLVNPYRYRGYYYDYETGYYYLKTRYYNPEWGRFLNADGYGGEVGELLTHNVYAYCSNNPISRYDPTGNFSIAITVAITTAITHAIEAAIATAATAVTALATAKVIDTVKDRTVVKEKAEPITKKPPKQTEYWAADKDANKQEELTYLGAQMRVARGENIIAANQFAAYKIAVLYPTRRLEKDKGKEGIAGYYWHYHVNREYNVNNIHGAPHIWFEGPKLFDY